MGATDKNCFNYAAKRGFGKLRAAWQALSKGLQGARKALPSTQLLRVLGAPARASPRVEVRDQTGPANIYPEGNRCAGLGFGQEVVLTPFLSLFKEKPEEINKYWTRQGAGRHGLGEEQC